jgi:hypothetical protein
MVEILRLVLLSAARWSSGSGGYGHLLWHKQVFPWTSSTRRWRSHRRRRRRRRRRRHVGCFAFRAKPQSANGPALSQPAAIAPATRIISYHQRSYDPIRRCNRMFVPVDETAAAIGHSNDPTSSANQQRRQKRSSTHVPKIKGPRRMRHFRRAPPCQDPKILAPRHATSNKNENSPFGRWPNF